MTTAHDAPEYADVRAFSDLPALDVTRCADGLAGQCPQAGRCERTAPAAIDIGPTTLTLFNAARLAEGYCRYYIPVELVA